MGTEVGDVMEEGGLEDVFMVVVVPFLFSLRPHAVKKRHIVSRISVSFFMLLTSHVDGNTVIA